jgi:hypothetical protein
VYANGGYYGGMYAFDAYSGAQVWSAGLPQYDEWTPAVDAKYAYAYLGEYSPKLYALDRKTGKMAWAIEDPDFDWNGWSMNLSPLLGDATDVLAIHDGRLISFDLGLHNVRWVLDSSFSGQPSVARNRIYAVDGTRVVVLDEPTGAELWGWQPASGTPIGRLIVTDTHLLVSTDTEVHAVDLETHESVWSYAASGHLALADGNLYVASETGVLTAITMPRVAPPLPPLSLSIANASIKEPATGRASMTFAVTLNRPSDNTVEVRYATLNQSAVAPGDYGMAAGTLTFAPGTTRRQIVVWVNADAAAESVERFFVVLKKPVRATLDHVMAEGTIE